LQNLEAQGQDSGVIRAVRRASHGVIDVLESVHQGMRRRSESVEGGRRRSNSMDSEIGLEGEKPMPAQLSLARKLMVGMTRKMSAGSLFDLVDGADAEGQDRHHRKELLELDAVIAHNRIAGWMLVSVMKALDGILKEPFAYLCKVPDPMILRMAMEYINNNDLTNYIYLLHFVDDKDVMRAHKEFMFGIKKQIARGKIKAEEENAYSEAFLIQSMLISRPEEEMQTLESFLGVDSSHIDLKKAIERLPSSARELSSTAKVLDTHYKYVYHVNCFLI
jgi:hypothetical protein